MAQTPPPSVSAAPGVPIRGTSTFKILVDAFLTWMALVVPQLSDIALNVYNNALDCYNNAVAAAASAANAAGIAGATVWVSGTAYAAGVSKFSPLNFKTYRSRAPVTSAVDPASDPTNWELLSYGALPFLHVRNQQASGVMSGDSFTGSATISRVLNTTVANTLTGASLSSSNVTLPAGTYDCLISAPGYNQAANKASLYDVTAAATVLVGTSANAVNGGQISTSVVRGRFTIAAAHVFSVKHWASGAGNGGYPTTSGLVEVYTEALFWKVA